MVSDVGLVQVDPETESLGDLLPLLHVAPDASLAEVDKGLHSVLFDFFLRVDAEFLADFHFYGQPMGVPARNVR